MRATRFIIQSFRHYAASHLLTALGVAIATTIILGALIVGSSVEYSLKQIALKRIGNTVVSLTSGDRFFTHKTAIATGAVPLLRTEGVAVVSGGEKRLEKVTVLGIDSLFNDIVNADFNTLRQSGNAIISSNVAERLNLAVGERFTLRFSEVSLVPANAPFVSDEERHSVLRLTVSGILSPENGGTFNLRNTQTPPFSVFISLNDLQKQSNANGLVNTALYTSGSIYDIEKRFKNSWTLEDAGYTIQPAASDNSLQLSSQRVFLDPIVDSVFRNEHRILTYFVNGLRSKNHQTPYSFVSTLPDSSVRPNGMVVNQWLADDLNLNAGDTLWMRYFLVGPLRELTDDSTFFIVESIAPMQGIFADASLVPDIPGLSDVGSCGDWQTGVPINLQAIRDKDEAYWNSYKGAPKAFIATSTAQKLWSNRYGNLTAIRFTRNSSIASVEQRFTNTIDPLQLGFTFVNNKETSLAAATGGVDFGQLFMGLSFFILLSGIILTSLLMAFHVKKRAAEMGTLAALGFTKKQITRLLVAESLLTALVGTVIGFFAAILYNMLVFNALNKVWNDIVRTTMLQLHFDIGVLAIGISVSFFVAIFTLWFSVKRAMRNEIQAQMRQQKSRFSTSRQRLLLFIALATTFMALWFLYTGISGNISGSFSQFFTSGLLLFVAFLSWYYIANNRIAQRKRLKISPITLIIANTNQHITRSTSVVLLFALGLFLVLSTGLNRKDLTVDSSLKTSGTGGFFYFAETTLPILFNLNEPRVKNEQGITEVARFVQFYKAEGDDASCLNLNRISQPAILGVDAESITGRFSFAVKTEGIPNNDSWSILNDTLDGGLIPAIADQTVIKWGLGKNVGDTLIYSTTSGDTLRLKLVAGLANSVFQGYVIISHRNFLKYYPSISGSQLFLVDVAPERSQSLAAELKTVFRDFGITMEPTAQKLSSFYVVENTYLSIFLILGWMGILIGIVGFGVVILRSLHERSEHIALLKALGFTHYSIVAFYVSEFLLLVAVGFLIGVFTSVIAVLPSLLSSATEVSFGSVVWITLSLLITAIVVVVAFVWFAVWQKKPPHKLRGL
jgi:putative ABC transport system permease protein